MFVLLDPLLFFNKSHICVFSVQILLDIKTCLFFQTIVRGENKNVRGVTGPSVNNNLMNGIPKTSHVARSNSLRSSSPPRPRRHQPPNMPPVLPEGEILVMPPQYNPAAINHNQFPVSPFFYLYTTCYTHELGILRVKR